MAVSSSSSSGSALKVALLGNFIFLGPLLWLQELAQNVLTRAVTGDWGWHYPREGSWYSFHTMPTWGLIAVVWAAMHTHYFLPKKIDSLVVRFLLMGVVGWVAEFLNGAIQDNAGLPGLQIWPNARPCEYVPYGAFLWWVQNAGTWLVLNKGLVAVGTELSNLSVVSESVGRKKVN